MMSNISSPTRFNSAEDHLLELEDNLERLKSPLQSVKPFNAKVGDYDYDMVKHNNHDNSIDMYVPDRILVVGQDQYFGTTAPPRELRLENSVRPPDPGFIHVETPPRVITLSEYKFPTVGEDEISEEESESLNNLNKFTTPVKNIRSNNSIAIAKDTDWTPLNGSDVITRGNISALPPSEEIVHLRRQMAKLNRRLMALELESVQQRQREMGLLALGAAYFLTKLIIWLNK